MQLVGTPLNLSFGVATFGEDGLTLDELTQRRGPWSLRGQAGVTRPAARAPAHRLRRAGGYLVHSTTTSGFSTHFA